MPKITFVQPDGSSLTVETALGTTVMEAAVRGLVSGIEGECGGACACATCHVYVDEAWQGQAGAPDISKPGPMEEDMLDFASGRRLTSRLACQIKMVDALDGLMVHVPTTQG